MKPEKRKLIMSRIERSLEIMESTTPLSEEWLRAEDSFQDSIRYSIPEDFKKKSERRYMEIN